MGVALNRKSINKKKIKYHKLKMNKNIIIVGAIAAGLYLLSQGGKKTSKAVVIKKAPRRPKRKYPRPHFITKTRREIAKKKAKYNKPKIKRVIARRKPIYRRPKPRVIARKKPIYHKPKIKRVIARKKPIYRKLKPRVAILKKQILKRMARRKRRR